MDKPIYGVQYALTGKADDRCILNGNTWAESRVLPKETVTSCGAKRGYQGGFHATVRTDHWKARSQTEFLSKFDALAHAKMMAGRIDAGEFCDWPTY